MTDATKCPAWAWDGFHSSTCGRPVKRNGKCGIHAAAEERVARNLAEEEAARQERERLASELSARLGIMVTAMWQRPGLLITEDAAHVLLDRSTSFAANPGEGRTDGC